MPMQQPMQQPMQHLAVIPARGGSRRIPRKNIKPFAGKPMIAYALQAAQQSGLFAHILVSTDDAEIADVARQYGAEVPFLRPAELADDHSGVIPVVQQSIQACRDIGWQFDAVCCIFPCVPLLQSADLVQALQIMQQAQADFSFAVSEFPSRIQRALRREANGAMQAFFPEHTATRTQDLEAAYFDVGQFYWG
ncbi:MAG: pseudaminic acid cytidylyltransferase, partial [Pseudomonadota bacterium]